MPLLSPASTSAATAEMISRITVGDSINQAKLKQMWTKLECKSTKQPLLLLLYVQPGSVKVMHRKLHRQKMFDITIIQTTWFFCLFIVHSYYTFDIILWLAFV